MPGAPSIVWHSGAAPYSTPANAAWTAALTLTQQIPAGSFVLIIPVIDFGATTPPGNAFSVADSGGNTYTEFTAYSVTDIGSVSQPTPGSHIVWYKANHPGLSVGATITCTGYEASGFHVYVIKGVDSTTPIPSVAKSRLEVMLTAGVSSGVTAAVSRTNVLLIGGISENPTSPPNTGNVIAFSANEIPGTWTIAEIMQYTQIIVYSSPNYDYVATRLVTGYQALTAAAGAQSFTTAAGTTTQSNAGVNYTYNEVFCIVVNGETNIAPNAPTLNAHANMDPSASSVFTWNFSDPNTIDGQTAYQLQIMTNPGGTLIYDSGKIASTASTATLPAATLTAGTNYQWKVRTWDQSDAVGPYSSLGSFIAAVGPTIAITSPVSDGATQFTSTPTITWSYAGYGGVGQANYRLVVQNGAITAYDSGVVNSVATSQITSALSAGVVYTATLTVTDTNGLSSVAVRTFVVNVLSPIAPSVTTGPSPDAGAVRLTITTRS